MSKKRRTKKEKMNAAARHDLSGLIRLETVKEAASGVLEKPAVHTPRSSTNYTYVITGVRKTLTITSIIVFINVVFFLLLKLKLVNIFGIGF
jgi:hypothetical protein